MPPKGQNRQRQACAPVQLEPYTMPPKNYQQFVALLHTLDITNYYSKVDTYITSLISEIMKLPDTREKKEALLLYNTLLCDSNIRSVSSGTGFEFFLLAPFDAINNSYWTIKSNAKEIVSTNKQGLYYHPQYKLGWFPCVIRGNRKSGVLYIYPIIVDGEIVKQEPVDMLLVTDNLEWIKNWISHFPGPLETDAVSLKYLLSTYGWYDENYNRPEVLPKMKVKAKRSRIQRNPSDSPKENVKRKKRSSADFNEMKALTTSIEYIRKSQEYINRLHISVYDGAQDESTEQQYLDSIKKVFSKPNEHTVIVFWVPLTFYVWDLWNNGKLSEFAPSKAVRNILKVCRTSDTAVKWIPLFMNIADVKSGTLNSAGPVGLPAVNNQFYRFTSADLNKLVSQFLNQASVDPASIDPGYKEIYLFYLLEPPDISIIPAGNKEARIDVDVDVDVDVSHKRLLSLADTVHDFHYLGSANLQGIMEYVHRAHFKSMQTYFKTTKSSFDITWLNKLSVINHGQRIEKYITTVMEKDVDYLSFSSLGASEDSMNYITLNDALSQQTISQQHQVVKLGIKPSKRHDVSRVVTDFYTKSTSDQKISLQNLLSIFYGGGYKVLVDQGIQVSHDLFSNDIIYTPASLYDGSLSINNISSDIPDRISAEVSKATGELFRMNSISVGPHPDTGKLEVLYVGDNSTDSKTHRINESWLECRPNTGKTADKINDTIVSARKCAPASIKTDEDYSLFTFDTKRAGDQLQVIACKALNDKEPRVSHIFITHDKLAALYARLMKQPVIYTEKDNAGAVFLHMYKHDSVQLIKNSEKEYIDMRNTLARIFTMTASIQNEFKKQGAGLFRFWESSKNTFTLKMNIMFSRMALKQFTTTNVPPILLKACVLLCLDLLSLQQKLSKNVRAYKVLIDDYAANYDTFQEYRRAPFNLKNYSSLSRYFRKFKSYAVGHEDISKDGDVATTGTSIILYHFDVLHAHFQLLFEISTVVDAFCGENNELYPRLRELLTGITECVGRIKPGVDPLLDINGYFDLLESLQQIENDTQLKCRQILRNKVEDLILDTVTINPTVAEFKKQFMAGGGDGTTAATDKSKFKYYDTLYNNRYTFSMYLFEKYPYLLPLYYAYLNNMPITLRNTRINTLLKQFNDTIFRDHSSQFLNAYKQTEHITTTKNLLNHISRSEVHELPSRHIFTQKELSRALALARRKKVGLIKPSPKKVKVGGGSNAKAKAKAKAKPQLKSNAGSRGK
jgi:hypothetical protein